MPIKSGSLEYPDGTQIVLCEHVSIKRRSNPKYQAYVSLWAGEHLRFEICRLCSQSFFGILLYRKMAEAMKEAFMEYQEGE